jgi:hypothetical protein
METQRMFCLNVKIETFAILKKGKWICQACGEEVLPVVIRQKVTHE